MAKVKFMLVFAPDVSSVATAMEYTPFDDLALEQIFSEVHRRTPSVKFRGRPREYEVFNVYPHCFAGITAPDVTEELTDDLRRRVMVALLDCRATLEADQGGLHRVMERFSTHEDDKNIYTIQVTENCSKLFRSAIVAENSELLTGMLIIELLKEHVPQPVKVVLGEMVR